MSSSNPLAGQQVKMGELKMAENLVAQRVESARKTVNEVETLKVEEVRRTVQTEMNLDKSIKAFQALSEKVTGKILAITEDAKGKIEAIAIEAAKKTQAVNEAAKIKRDSVQVELDAEKAKLDQLKTEVENEIGKRSSSIKQKAAAVRANLSQELNRLNDQLYATVLPANLLSVVDQAPKIGSEQQFAQLAFSGKK